MVTTAQGESESSDASPSLPTRMLQRVISLAQALSVILMGVTIATALARYHWLADLLANLRVQLRRSHPHQILHPQDTGNFGIGLWSALTIDDHESFTVDESLGIQSIEAMIGGYRVFATHPLPPMSARGFAARNQQLARVADRVRDRRARFPDQPVVLVGDLNVTPWSPFFADFAQHSGLRRAIDGIDLVPTWYALTGFPFGLVLDHAMISRELRCLDHRVGENIGSDHRSITVGLCLSP